MYEQWNYSIWKDFDNSLVHLIDLSWNTTEASILLMYEKLVQLGVTYYYGKVVIVEPE